MITQFEFNIKANGKGFFLISNEINKQLDAHKIKFANAGLFNLFIKHTSCGLTLCENYDIDVRHDLNLIFDDIVKESQPYYKHIYEGSDDMPSHAKSILVGPSLTIPIANNKLALGTWQGIYLCEFRKSAPTRTILATIYS